MSIMSLTDLLETCHASGIELRADVAGDRILYRPKEVVDLRLYNAIREHKRELLALLSRDDPEITWRAEAMRQQIPAHGPILTLRARSDVPNPAPAGMCDSCGEPKESGQTYVCRTCQTAKHLALEGIL
jgi:hypothetical protein